jgi:hypothetical protein
MPSSPRLQTDGPSIGMVVASRKRGRAEMRLALMIVTLSFPVAAQTPSGPGVSRASIDALQSLVRDLALPVPDGKAAREIQDWLNLWAMKGSDRDHELVAAARFVRQRVGLARPQRPVFRLDRDHSNEPILIEEVGARSGCRRTYLAMVLPRSSATTCCAPKRCELEGATEVVSRVLDAGDRKDARALRALAPTKGIMELVWTGQRPPGPAVKPDEGGAWRAQVTRRAIPRQAWHLLPPLPPSEILAFRCKPAPGGRTECCASVPMDDVCISIRNDLAGAVVERVTTYDWTH